MKNLLSNLTTASILWFASPSVGANISYEPPEITVNAWSPELVDLCKATVNSANSIILNRNEVCDLPSITENNQSINPVVEYSKDGGKTWILYLLWASFVWISWTLLWRLRKIKNTSQDSWDDPFMESLINEHWSFYNEGITKDDDDNIAPDINYVSEAEIYMTYGLHTQAVKMLEKALELSHMDIVVCVKLLEVYHILKDKNKFEILFRRKLKQFSLSDWTEIVSQVKSWWRDLDVDNPLYEETKWSNSGFHALGDYK